MKSVLIVAAALAAIAAPAAGGDAGQWSLTGSGTGGGLSTGDHVMIGAHSDVGGTNPRGHVEATGKLNGVGQNYNLGGEVECLSVVGSKALVVWKLRQPLLVAGFPEFDWEGAYIVDNGEPVDGRPVDQMVDFVLTQQGRDLFCSTAADVFVFPASPIDSGNYVIHGG